MGKKHGKRTVKASRWFRKCCLRWRWQFRHSGTVKTVSQTLDSFHSLPNQRTNALFASYRANDLWGFDREHIAFYLKQTLLIGSGPGLILRNFDLVSDLIALKAVRS